ncbi:hypothetical protein GCM10023165_25990 [Variovorax defluvii]|uniref:Calcineurin-like phosphoesterase domain-containing protein n=1 Tax=Variovorax defluvii TaxID=913761 RepID=A0ABP8HS52_9BURK
MKQRTIVISDLHVGGGPGDPGDDHVYQKRELVRFIASLGESEPGRKGGIELFINGDFLEFAQTAQEVHRSTGSKAWCSEPESLKKLEVILAGHPEIFSALGAFQALGNQVTVAAGNHDVDLYWPSVQKALVDAVHPGLAFAIGQDWVERYGGKLQIAHGHLPDPVNTFKSWDKPLARHDNTRLEMCPGTLFMVKFVNLLEREYPFADNIYPVQRLAALLKEGDKKGLAVVSWAFLRFSARHAKTLGAATPMGTKVLSRLGTNTAFAEELSRRTGTSVETLRGFSEDKAAEFVLVHWPEIADMPDWKKLTSANTLAGDGQAANSLGTLIMNASFGKESLRDEALKRATAIEATEVVVMGHTHLPDKALVTSKVRYFNPGSWTRYADVSPGKPLTLDDLRDESAFPYSLNYVEIDEASPGAPLQAQMKTFESQEDLLRE